MDKRPIRRRYNDNNYRLISDEKNGIYIIKFIDSKKQIKEIEVSKDIFDLFDINERYENARFYEYATRIIKSNMDIENIPDHKSIEEIIIKNSISETLKKEINNLPIIQRNRIIKYFFEDKTYEEIAKEENCSKVAIKYSIDIAINNLSKKIKK